MHADRIRRFGRAGFTLVELMVVVSIVSVLMALLLPAVMTARAASRRAQCQNNLRNLGIAMIAAAESARRFPASGNIGVSSAGAFVPFHSWAVNLLPWIDKRDLADEWNLDLPSNSPGNAALAGRHISVLACPSDITVFGQGDLSYVVNGGFGWTSVSPGRVSDCPICPSGQALDLNGNGIACPADPKEDGEPSDRNLFFQTGFFFLENWRVPGGTARHHTFDDITDGLSQTIMLAENAKVGYDPYQPDTNWAAPAAIRNSFFVSFGVCFANRCSAGNVDYALANRGAHAINAGLDQPEGSAPWPSSFHTGGVHVVFGDGHVRFLSQSVDGAVYAALVSPQGSRITGPLRQHVLSDGEY